MPEQFRDVEALLADESFQRWLSGKASIEESRQWSAWLNETPAHRELYAEALKLWEIAHFRRADLPNLDQEFQRLQQRLRLQSTPSASIYNIADKRRVIDRDRRFGLSGARMGAIAIAAVLLIALLWQILPFQLHPGKTQYQTVTTDFGQRSRITLPDSTIIILNAHSSLRYPAEWTATTAREFELQGEAYFDVSSRPEGRQHDFVVHTADGDIQVVGTRFAVHERGEGTRVVVEEGGVEITVSDTVAVKTASPAKAMLLPGNLLRFNRGNRVLSPQIVNVGAYTTWWRDHLLLNDTPFEQIIQRLEETYGIHVEVTDERLLQRTLSGSIENHNLDVTTEALAKALRVTVHREGRSVFFGNVQSKAKTQ